MIDFQFEETEIVADNAQKTYWVSGFVELFYNSGRYEKIELTGGFSAISNAIILFSYVGDERQVSEHLKGLIIRSLIRETKRREVNGTLKEKA